MSSESEPVRFDPKDVLTFLKIDRQQAAKKILTDRQIKFTEIYEKVGDENLQQQAGRCLDCGNPYCEWKCPLHNYIPNWLELSANDRFEDAAALMHQTNPLPEICGRVCPQDRLCEQACTLNTGFGAVTIGAIEKSIADRSLENGWRPDLSAIPETGKRVAIIGAGPAGLGCAELLCRNGVKAVVFDQYPQIGGLLTFGIPGFKLEKEIIQKRRDFLEDIGVEFKLNTHVGSDISFEDLEEKYDAVFLGMGTYNSVEGELAGRDNQGVIKALDYLIGNINQQQSYAMKNYPYYDLQHKRVIVLGGGDTAMDCVRSAIRQQAETVRCVYRRTEIDMPGSRQEVQNAREEGVEFVFNLQPTAILSENGKVSGVEFNSTESTTGEPGKTVFLQADAVIIAFGFKASPADWFQSNNISTLDNGLVQTRPSTQPHLPYSQQTNISGVFAGGDMVRGADLVVTAIAEGREAAREILDYLQV